VGRVPAFYTFVRGLVRLGLNAYFRDIEVHGTEHLEGSGPRIIAGNHNNGMIDPILIIAASERPITFIAKAPLFKVPILGWFLRHLHCIPAYRSQDAGYAKEKNDQLYEQAARQLASGPALALFPEGKSHSEPQLAELKHGAAKIALEAETRQGQARIQPVGLHFERTRAFRGKVLVQFGPPIELGEWKGRYAEDPKAATASLTEELQRRLSDRILHAESQQILRLADLVERMGVLEEVGAQDLKSSFDRKKFLLDTYRDLRERAPAEVEALRTDLVRYQETLDLLKVRDDQVAQDYRFGRVLGFTLKNAILLILGLPFMALALVCNFPAYITCVGIVRMFGRDGDLRATYGLLPAIFIYPAYWAALAYAGWRLEELPGLLAVLVAAPLSGLVALHWMDRWGRVLRASWGLLAALALPGARASLRRIRRRVLDRVKRLAEALPRRE
jgi:1-acyl-sn-glycerol-3-phosphate acyltransferase